jgi:hypothetical protein
MLRQLAKHPLDQLDRAQRLSSFEREPRLAQL